jgi:hypothetical protein
MFHKATNVDCYNINKTLVNARLHPVIDQISDDKFNVTNVISIMYFTTDIISLLVVTIASCD